MLISDSSAGTTGKAGKSPLDELPPYITQITHFGQRADFSHDGKRILFIEKTFGDVFEVEIAGGVIRPMTHHYFHEGYTRALYLANGDILLSGARHFDADDPWPSRSEKNAELWVLRKDLSGPPTPLGEKCSEGPAVSRKSMKFAWTQGGAFYMANIVYEDGKPELADKRKILDKKDLPFECGLETQNLRPPDEKELIFSAYGYQGTDVMGLNIETGEVVNYSNAPDQYDEPEGIFPDGRHTLVECDKHSRKGTDFIDLYKLALDGSGRTERVTHFSDYPGYKASNPVVSDDGKFIAFQAAKRGDPAGVGRGILLLDLETWEQLSKPKDEIETAVDEIKTRYGVQVHHVYDRERFFPGSWKRPPINASGSQMDRREILRLLEVTRTFLSQYPQEVLDKNLSDIYFVKRMQFYGKPFGGTYANAAIYMDNQGRRRGYTSPFLLSTMHSEFSSILLANYRRRFPGSQWTSLNPDGFEYGGTGVEMLGQADIFGQRDELLEEGFLVKYCRSSLENDLNMYAFWAFTRADELKELATRYEKIGAKLNLFTGFYNTLSPEILNCDPPGRSRNPNASAAPDKAEASGK